ncbi:MAG: flagellar basal body L-ring protein FlgH [Woeseiaceae bacterium]|nr:flagellar basal body L-ring protein FlgH [Woeseiaceae bacterium]
MNINILAILIASFLISGCALRSADDHVMYSPPPVQQVYSPPADGTIFRPGTEVRLFEDLKAGRVGDILTVRLVERTNASKNSQTQTAKTTSATLGNPEVLGRPVTRSGIPLFSGSLDGQTAFDGQGTSSQSNSLDGDITVTVIDRLPNGNLVIQGEKWLTINQGKEFIRVSGIIRPNDIETDNSVLSTRIANAQIAYSAKGALAAANKMGLISRFFNSILHPY